MEEHWPNPKPSEGGGWTLDDLLTMRRVFVDEAADQAAQLDWYSARSWMAKVYTPLKRTDLLEAIWSLAKTSLEQVEALQSELELEALGDFQRRKYLSNGNGSNGHHA
jgi:hypothetical protein